MHSEEPPPKKQVSRKRALSTSRLSMIITYGNVDTDTDILRSRATATFGNISEERALKRDFTKRGTKYPVSTQKTVQERTIHHLQRNVRNHQHHAFGNLCAHHALFYYLADISRTQNSIMEDPDLKELIYGKIEECLGRIRYKTTFMDRVRRAHQDLVSVAEKIQDSLEKLLSETMIFTDKENANRTLEKLDIIRKELMEVAWSPKRHVQWCLDFEEQREIM
jgi:hypothetical protein